MKIIFPCLCIALLAIACNNAGTPEQKTKTDPVVLPPQPPIQAKNIADEFMPAGDSMIIPPFRITVQLSESAVQKLKNAKETIIVSAMFSGVPKDTNMKEYREWGEFALGSAQTEIPEPGTVRFENAKILKNDFDKLGSKDIQILINVYSGRRSTMDNLLHCDILQEPISKVSQQKNVLKGKLIYE